MSWTLNIECSVCHQNLWTVSAGVWTCVCGKRMLPGEIKPYHAELDRIARAQKAAEEAARAPVAQW